MFDKGDYVSYGNNGVCFITDISWMQPSRDSAKKQYYVLEPISSRTGRIYTPVDNEKVIIRKIISKNTADDLLEGRVDIEELPVGTDKEMEAEYKKLIRQGDCYGWLQIIRTISGKKKLREGKGKRLASVDDRYLKEAREKLIEEISFVTGLEKADVLVKLG